MATNEGTDPKSAERNLRGEYENLRKDMQLKQEAEAYERSKRDEKGMALLEAGAKMLPNKPAQPAPKEKSFAESLGKAAVDSLKSKGMKKGGAVKSASSRADGCAMRGKTRGKIV
jgi:hypothetical protein